ncbi:MAG: 23S rRNA (pseudouridine(1915)-N(3))-methyltransferase RlmH [Firmicutes bacterium]|nr:23S rRNA (pseudouridine(1915)-N(3))-methyltransferase RlmH [Bacillota bacterium]
MIKIICLGKLKEKYLIDLVDDYLKRISKYHKIELIELKDEDNLESEALNIKKHIGSNDYVITLEIEGKTYTSEELANIIDKTFINYSTITFIIGSSTGIDDSIKRISHLSLSFSKLTFPHGLFRGILLEQIYRSFKINNNESYHK